MSGPPVVAGPIYGLRTWVVRHGRLTAPFQGTPWPAGGKPLRAECSAGHTTPSGHCSCGLYGLHPFAHAEVPGGSVLGVIEAWGEIEVHRTGFRAELARPVLFADLPDDDHHAVAALARGHGAEVIEVDDAAGLAAVCRERDWGLSPATVRALVPTPRWPPSRAAVREASWKERLLGVVAGLASAAVALVLVVVLWNTVVGLGDGLIDALDGEPVPDPAAAPGLRIVDQGFIRGVDDPPVYYAVVRNEHPRLTASGVFPVGRFPDVGGTTDTRIDVEHRPSLAPGQTDVVIDVLEGDNAPERRPRRFAIHMAARVVRPGPARAPVRVERVRFDRGRCVVTARVVSDRRRAEENVFVLGRDARGAMVSGAFVLAGPLVRGAGEQVLARVDPRPCRRMRRAEAYWSAYPEDLPRPR